MITKNVYSLYESNVRSYGRIFPAEFTYAKGAVVRDKLGNDYLDFLSGCGSLNYGHNNVILKTALIDYIHSDGVTMSMDMQTSAKAELLSTINSILLAPRKLEYRLQFTSPTGANAVEAAIKLARKVTGRSNVIAFTNGFHGCTLGALGLTGSSFHRGHTSSPSI